MATRSVGMVPPVSGIVAERVGAPGVRLLWYRSEKGVPSSGSCWARIWLSHSMMEPLGSWQEFGSGGGGAGDGGGGAGGGFVPGGGQLKSKTVKCVVGTRQSE